MEQIIVQNDKQSANLFIEWVINAFLERKGVSSVWVIFCNKETDPPFLKVHRDLRITCVMVCFLVSIPVIPLYQRGVILCHGSFTSRQLAFAS